MNDTFDQNVSCEKTDSKAFHEDSVEMRRIKLPSIFI